MGMKEAFGGGSSLDLAVFAEIREINQRIIAT
jgi:hypothetical protein